MSDTKALLEQSMQWLSRHRWPQAEQGLRAVLALDADSLDALAGLGRCLLAQNRLDEALNQLQSASARFPRCVAFHIALGDVEVAKGRPVAALGHYHQALVVDPRCTFACIAISSTKRFTSDDDADIAHFESMLRDRALPPRNRADVHFALGKIRDDLGQYQLAFEHFSAGNDIARQAYPFDISVLEDLVTRVINFFDSRFIDTFSYRSHFDLPTLIVGMPRSGSSLLEQILASHPQVHGAGESMELETCIGAALAKRAFPEGFASIDDAAAQKLVSDYTGYLHKLAPHAARVVDKRPGNFIALGVVAAMMPAATVIESKRDAMDTCLSCYFQPFKAQQPYSTDLALLGRYHRCYERLMQHWQAVAPALVLRFDYERLIADPEAACQKLLSHCGLPWDARCMSFHTTDRAVGTASQTQVREPLHNKSVGRWKHYEEFLDPLIDSLHTTES